MIIDPRTGSEDLARPLAALGVPVQLMQLEFGDAAWLGLGPGKRQVPVGVEVKKLGDLLQCIRDDRYVGHQLKGLKETYEVRHLLVEGLVTAGEERELLTFKKGVWRRPYEGSTWMYEAFRNWTLTQQYRSGIHVDFTPDRRGTVAWLAGCFHWWTEKTYEEHRSHEGLYFKPMVPGDNSDIMDPITDQTMRRMLVAQGIMRGVGYEKAKAAAERFRSVEQMYWADEVEWRNVPGFGKKLAAQMFKAFRVVE